VLLGRNFFHIKKSHSLLVARQREREKEKEAELEAEAEAKEKEREAPQRVGHVH